MKTYQSFKEKEDVYLDNAIINDFDEFKREYRALTKSGREYIFRGVSDASFKMYSSAQRYWFKKGKDLVTNGTIKDYKDFLQTLVGRCLECKTAGRYISKYGIHYNEMWMLALMQHYGAPSIMLDFSHDINSGLFFMCDGATRPQGDESLGDYVSLYFIDKKVDWVNTSIQKINSDGVESIRNNIIPYYGTNLSMYEVCLNEFELLPFRKYMDDKISFASLEDNIGGAINIDIPELNFHTQYEIINGRLKTQSGLFFAVFSENEPFAELLLKAETPNKIQFGKDGLTNEIPQPEYARKLIHCWNVNKRILNKIRWQYLYPNLKTKFFMYRKWSCEDNRLELEFRRAKQVF